MASHAERPTVDLVAGKQVLQEQLPRVLALKQASLETLGWRLHSIQTLLIPMTGLHQGVSDDYLLRLDFVTGPDWPPSARFVNPETLDYELHVDQHHLPKLASSEVHVHPAYRAADGRELQLICCSATFQYYDVSHGGEDRVLWQRTDNFLRTLSAIERAFASAYAGRFERHGA